MMRNIYIAICIFLSVSAWGQEVQILDKADVLQQAVDGVVLRVVATEAGA